ncbi:hypothetical protein L3X38_033387 [Prunus dulcis]|uniref:Retrovirus-related Pol polyprotein from transposon TNT 1-94 n=1 Tax=Prunus dulcis TaxID=3755 RepID=A0AAD4VFT0_PRUDU|nr:hypothetical protein L3X38_033387 [Prunus dulcis]
MLVHLDLIQGCSLRPNFSSRIVNEETSKGAWDILKQSFRGDKQSYLEKELLQKLLISLPRSYDSICSVIEHSKDLDTLEISRSGLWSLKNFELRLDRHTENSTEKAFTSLNIESKSSKNGSSSGGNKSQKNWKEKCEELE